MNQYITGAAIKLLREKKHMTQSELAEKLCVSDKTVSKWETGKGFPDISLLEELAKALDVSVPELLSGTPVSNTNVSANMAKVRFYVCPVCGNIITGVGPAVVSCHGITLPPLESESAGGEHDISVSNVEDEYFVTSSHPMTKEHYISFMASVSCERLQLVKLYPEGPAETRLPRRMMEKIYFYCSRDGLFVKKVR